MGDMITVFKCLQEKFDKRGLFRAREKMQEPVEAGCYSKTNSEQD